MGGGEIGRRSPEWRCRVRVYVMLVSRVWCLLAPSRGGVPPLGDTQSAEPTLGDLCLLYGPFPANAHPPRGQGSLARSPIPIIRPAGCAS